MNELDKALNRNQRWGEVSKLFRMTLLISFFAVCVAELLHENILKMYLLGRIFSRFDLYLISMYFFAVPIIVFKVRKALGGYAFPFYSLIDRCFYTLAMLVLMSALVFSPVFLTFFGWDGAGRAGAVYRLMSNFFGLTFIGGFIFYGVSISLWMLIFGVQGLWEKRDKGVL